MMRLVRHGAVPAIVLVTAVLLVGCVSTPSAPEPRPSSAAPSTAPKSPAPEPDPELIPGGSTEDNLPYFDFVNAALLSGENPGGRAVIDNLVAVGFDKAAMQVMADKTPRGVAVDSLQFSVQLGEECLIGQVGAGGYTSMVGSTLESGGCLVGKTRVIDW